MSYVHKLYLRIGENPPSLMLVTNDDDTLQDAYNMARWIIKNKKYIDDIELEHVEDRNYSGSY